MVKGFVLGGIREPLPDGRDGRDGRDIPYTGSNAERCGERSGKVADIADITDALARPPAPPLRSPHHSLVRLGAQLGKRPQELGTALMTGSLSANLLYMVWHGGWHEPAIFGCNPLCGLGLQHRASAMPNFSRLAWLQL